MTDADLSIALAWVNEEIDSLCGRAD